MMYPEMIVGPMREELTRVGVQELRTAAEVDAAMQEAKGTAMVVVNSICGCAARNARPAIAMAMQHATRPDAAFTVFAGQDREATAKARDYMVG
ncbi:MAG: BrxA/BrxB family bacilliredoxin, partial [Gemmatimonadaceae bacterium]|nr:BrxA/BrxB family bacilliredoxin [Gemmatimonadaceae bacterium]